MKWGIENIVGYKIRIFTPRQIHDLNLRNSDQQDDGEFKILNST